MRLIDADRLLNPSFTDMFDEPVKMTMFSRYAIESQPTVKAIPIEWLKRWFERQVWQGSSPTDRIHCKASDIIEDWEKENETN